MIGKLQEGAPGLHRCDAAACGAQGKSTAAPSQSGRTSMCTPWRTGEIAAYAACGEPLDKAGAYGIQGRFAAYIQKIDGDYGNVVGLPLGRLYHELKNLMEDDDK